MVILDNDDDRVVNHGNNYVDADEVTHFIHWILLFVAIPIVSVFGVIGNIFSIIVLSKHGFKKSSNILLFSLAISDMTFIFGLNGAPKVLYEWGRAGFPFSESEAHIWYYFYHFFDTLNWGSGPVSLCIPVLITVERFVAVFLPLRFSFIITPRRTTVAAIVPFVLFYGLQFYARTWFQFAYVFDPVRNITVGMTARSSFYWRQRDVTKAMQMSFNCMIVLITFVGSGCVAIGIKIKLAANKRLKMTNQNSGDHTLKSDSGTSRTTKTLLCLCCFYTVACALITVPAIVPKYMVFPLFTDDPNFSSVGVFVYRIYKLVFVINASCNFVIYVAMNKKFRDTFCELLHIKRQNNMHVRRQKAENSTGNERLKSH